MKKYCITHYMKNCNALQLIIITFLITPNPDFMYIFDAEIHKTNVKSKLSLIQQK